VTSAAPPRWNTCGPGDAAFFPEIAKEVGPLDARGRCIGAAAGGDQARYSGPGRRSSCPHHVVVVLLVILVVGVGALVWVVKTYPIFESARRSRSAPCARSASRSFLRSRRLP